MRRRLISIAGGIAVVGLAALTFEILSIARDIRRQSTVDETKPADIILVLGAAEYRGKPSPVLRGRLDHGLELFHEKKAPLILTTGGAGGDPTFTEGEVGRDYLVRRGVPSEAILVEAEGESTAHSLAAAAAIMHRMNLKTCIVVSDGYHIYRAKKMLESEGFSVYGSPRPEAPRSGPRQWWLYTRQAFGYLLWRWGIRI
jgi:uncharacterized SAM-binding protein YcdF (DUF218 family)